jgi:general secretion pathway protein L
MSTLRVFLPASDRPDSSAALRWVLLERREAVRDGACDVAAMPQADEVEAILPASRVLFARLKLPRVGDATIRELLPFAVEDRLLADPAQIHAVAGPTDPHGDTAVAVVDRAWLQRMIGMLADAGLVARRACCESALVPLDAGEWHVMLHPGSGVLVDDAGIATTFDWHAGGALPLALRIALDEAATRGDRPRVVRVHEDVTPPRETVTPAQAGAQFPDIATWSADASVPFERSTPWRDVERASLAADAIDLLSGDFAPRRRGLAAMRVSRAAIAFVAAIVVIQVAFTGIDTWRLSRERAALDAQREAIFRRAFPEAKVVVDPDLQMARNLAQLRAARGLASGDDFLVRLTEAARESGERASSIDYAQGRLTVKRAGAAR